MINLYEGKIISDDNIMFGAYCISGTRISIVDILQQILEQGSINKVKEESYPQLEIDQINLALQFAIDKIVRGDNYNFFIRQTELGKTFEEVLFKNLNNLYEE